MAAQSYDNIHTIKEQYISGISKTHLVKKSLLKENYNMHDLEVSNSACRSTSYKVILKAILSTKFLNWGEIPANNFPWGKRTSQNKSNSCKKNDHFSWYYALRIRKKGILWHRSRNRKERWCCPKYIKKHFQMPDGCKLPKRQMMVAKEIT